MDENIDLSKDTELKEALKEFEEKNVGQTPMPTQAVETNVMGGIPKAIPVISESSKMAQWVMKHSGGSIKDERQAEYFLLGFAVLAVIVSLFLVFSMNNKKVKIDVNPETGQEIIPGQIPGQI